MKKTFLTALCGALVGGIIASMLTITVTTTRNYKENAPYTESEYSYSEKSNITHVSTETSEKKEELSVEEIAKRVGPSVVGISCTTITRTYFGNKTTESIGSGIIISEDGHIVTNHHVIKGASSIKVKLTSGNEYNAVIVGGDEKTDIAVIKISATEKLNVAIIGNSDAIEVGELAVAIGNPLASELFGTVTVGVISGINRSMTVGQREMNLIQTDAAINPGNSGGALINKYGEVIGINSVKLVDDSTEGLGFAIPMNEAVPIVQDLTTYGYVKGRPMIGVSVIDITAELAYYNHLPVQSGLYIMSVTDGSGAQKAGLTRGDIIVKFDGIPVSSTTEMNKIRDKHKAGKSVKVTFLRNGQEKEADIILTEDMSGKKN